jgi:cytochrome b561
VRRPKAPVRCPANRTALCTVITVVTNPTTVLNRRQLRNSDTGYGLVTKALHWSTVLLLLLQFGVGYAMTRVVPAAGPELLPLHVGLGVGILVIAGIRLGWRVATALPPWADRLSTVERRIAKAVERSLYALLIVIPLSGLALTRAPGTTWPVVLGLHIASHVAFFAVLAVHLALVVKNRLLRRMV